MKFCKLLLIFFCGLNADEASKTEYIPEPTKQEEWINQNPKKINNEPMLDNLTGEGQSHKTY